MSIAWAQDAAAAAPNAGAQMLFSYAPIILIFAVFYFLILRPQQQAAKAQAAMLAALAKGDDVLLNGGVMGRISGADAATLTLKVNAEDSILAARDGVARKLSAEESKALDHLLSKKK
jgi:preprotein translocase subunit YajC